MLLSIVALIAVSGCVQTEPDPCTRFHKDSQDKDYCLADYAEQHKDPKVCDLIYREILREDCYRDVAVLTNNIELCKKIVSTVSQGARTVCFKKIAINLTDASICGHISDKQPMEGCYWDIAELTMNETLCSKLTSENWRNDCIKTIRFPECEDKDYCLTGYAEQYEDP